jgi:hypothetical protein
MRDGMGLIEKFIELAEDHPRPLLLTLLGVIIVGGTGGGIWLKQSCGSSRRSEERAFRN